MCEFARLEADLVQFDPVGGVVRVAGQRFLVELQGGVVILNIFSFLPGVILLAALRAARSEQAYTYTQYYLAPAAHALSVL